MGVLPIASNTEAFTAGIRVSARFEILMMLGLRAAKAKQQKVTEYLPSKAIHADSMRAVCRLHHHKSL